MCASSTLARGVVTRRNPKVATNRPSSVSVTPSFDGRVRNGAQSAANFLSYSYGKNSATGARRYARELAAWIGAPSPEERKCPSRGDGEARRASAGWMHDQQPACADRGGARRAGDGDRL